MGDVNNSGPEEKSEVTETGADNQGESQTDGGTDEEAGDAGTSENDSVENSDEAEAEGGESKDKKPEAKPTPPADEEPKTRKRNIDFILERKDRKIQKLQEKKPDAADAEEEQIEQDDDMDPDDAKLIDNRIKSYLEPLAKKQMQDEDAQEIGDFVKQNPDFAPYAAKVLKNAQHPSRKDIPIEALFYEVAGKDLMKIGAERAAKANAQARKSQAGGGAPKGSEAPKGAWDLSPEEFSAQQEAIRNKQRE